MSAVLETLSQNEGSLTKGEIDQLFAETFLEVTRDDLEVVLQNHLRPGASFLTIFSKTEPNIRLNDYDGNPIPAEWRTDFGRGKPKVWHLHKFATVNGMVCADYAKRVNKVRESLSLPPDFKADDMTWGMHRNIPYDEGERHTCLVDHYYVDCPTPGCKHKYDKSFEVKTCPKCGTPRKSGVFLYVFPLVSLNYYYQVDTDGSYIDPTYVHHFGKEWEEGKQGLDQAHEVRVRKYNLANILRLSANGRMYRIIGSEAANEAA